MGGGKSVNYRPDLYTLNHMQLKKEKKSTVKKESKKEKTGEKNRKRQSLEYTDTKL